MKDPTRNRSRNDRKTERIYDLEPTFITLKNHSFRINDISKEGIGIILEQESPRFAIGERFEAIPLPLQAGPVPVKGVVSHISVSAAGTRCGIMFLLESGQFDLITRFQEERRRPPEGR
jgi:hypothetical protein